MKKILYVRNGPYKVNPNLYNLQEIGFCKELCNLGYNCDIIYYSDQNKDEIIYENNGAIVKLLWRKGIKILRTGIYPSLLKKSFVNSYDLVITTEYSQIMSLLWTFFEPNVVLYNGPYYNLFKIPFTEKIYDFLFVKLLNTRLEKVFVKSTLSKEYLLKKGFTNIEVLGVGLDLDIFSKDVQKNNKVKNLVNIMNENRCILYIGSLDERKNFRFTLKIFEEINSRLPDVKLVVIGKGKKRYVDKCFTEINSKVRNNIIHIDKMDNKLLKFIYPKAKVFILPSKQEIFGMVLLEAMYFGVPTITSNNGGATTLIQNYENGIVVNNFDTTEWVNEIYKLLDNIEYSNNISNNARETIIEKYTWENVCNKFTEILKDDNKI
ncbi:MAG: glycosyltransferase family 4 protein [Clostridium sp.]|uniref:glycosyltransferase family 4 protein n=1 Tax=Clostridium sp. TaxID=1506 RepID=UPI0039A1D7E8